MEGHGKNPALHEEVELHLGLSMNGRYGVDPTRGQKLDPSSSLAKPAIAIIEGDSRPADAVEFESQAASARRMLSLPIETVEEALRRRKELEAMRPMEARRERMGKMKASREKKNGVGSSSSPDPIEVMKLKQAVEVCNQGVPSPKNSVLDMPLVTTKDIGPNGRKIRGLLYIYKREEEVKILCVCHGVFFTPKEFVAHGGGGDVEHPLKHIVVSSFPLA